MRTEDTQLVYFLNLRWLLLSCVVTCLDLITKYWVMTHCVLGKSIFVSFFVNFYYVYNFGIAFSIFSEFGVKRSNIFIFIIIFIVIILCIGLCFIDHSYSSYFKIAYAMVIGGAFGNLIDRIRYGVVIDFVDFHICDWHFPTFNLADLSIFIGVVMIFIYNYK